MQQSCLQTKIEHYSSTCLQVAALGMCTIKLVHTQVIIVFKQDVYAVNTERSTQIYFPPHGFVRCGPSYFICPRTSSSISINCVTCCIQI